MSDQLNLRIARIERKLGLSTGILLINCRICGEITHQPATMGFFPEGICASCVEKEREKRNNRIFDQLAHCHDIAGRLEEKKEHG